MNEIQPIDGATERDPRAETETPPHSASWVVSLMFWLTLCGAALLYAAVALSPKAAEWITAKNQYSSNARRLAQLEDEVEYLERVASALKADPQFAERLAKASVPADPQDNQLVPVTEELLFGGYESTSRDSKSPQNSRWTDVIFLLASSSRHRSILLTTAIVLTIVGFTFLNDSESGYLKAIGAVLLGVAAFPIRRYRKSYSSLPQGDDTTDSSPRSAQVLNETFNESNIDSTEQQWRINAPSNSVDE